MSHVPDSNSLLVPTYQNEKWYLGEFERTKMKYRIWGGEGGAAGWCGGAVDAGCVEAFLAAALSRVMRAAVPIPAVAAASVSHSAAVGGSVVGFVGLL